jgi:tRNA(fMet)-specific endonuclease VapC
VRYLLDTNACIALLNKRPISVGERLDRTLASGESAAISSIALHELWYGVAKSIRVADNSARLTRFSSGILEVLSFEREDARIAGEVRAALEARGRPIGLLDTLLAGQALRHEMILVTANEGEFARIPDLRWENWARRSR